MMGALASRECSRVRFPSRLILEELEKQYKVGRGDPTNPIELGRFDAMLVVQRRRWATAIGECRGGR